jgi:hypothetical protein
VLYSSRSHDYDADQARMRLARLARVDAHYGRFAAGPFPERAIRHQLSAHRPE